MVKIATIGTGSIVESFLDAIEKTSVFEYYLTYSRDMNKSEKFANRYGAKKYCDNLQDITENEEVEAVYIASPNSFHYNQAIMMMSSGKHVICEKPIASNFQELSHMIKVAKENNVVLMEAMRPIFDPVFHKISENIEKIGEIKELNFYFCRKSGSYDEYFKGKNQNVFDLNLSTGALMDIGVYPLHTVIYLLGKPKEIEAKCEKLDNGADISGVIIAKYEGFYANIIYSKKENIDKQNEIIGEKGKILIDNITKTDMIKIVYNDKTEEVIVNGKFNDEKCKNMKFEIKEFRKLIDEKNISHEYLKYSMDTSKTLDKVRKILGINFSADNKFEM